MLTGVPKGRPVVVLSKKHTFTRQSFRALAHFPACWPGALPRWVMWKTWAADVACAATRSQGTYNMPYECLRHGLDGLFGQVGLTCQLPASARKTRCHRSIAPRRDEAAARLPTSTQSMSSTVQLLSLVARRRLTLLTAAGLVSRDLPGDESE